MDDPGKLYTDADRAAFKSPLCATCGSSTIMTWTDLYVPGDPERWATNLPHCTNDSCPAKIVG
jgi:hypothetical protein